MCRNPSHKQIEEETGINFETMTKDREKEKELAAKEAIKFVFDDQVIGLGTGSTAYYVIKEIGNLVSKGLKIKAVPTSNSTVNLAHSFKIPLLDINDVEFIDVTLDGADEFNGDLVLIKGGGGALLKEKIVASMTRREIIIADSSKKVSQLGKFPLPIEVIPFAANYVKRRLLALGGIGKIRTTSGKSFITDEGNYIIDTEFGVIDNPGTLSAALNEIEGLVCHGLFIDLASTVIMGVADTDTTVTFEK